MQPFNVSVEAPADELDTRLREAIDAVAPTDEESGGARKLALQLAGYVDDLLLGDELGSNVDSYAVNIAGQSIDGRTTPDAELAELSIQLRALTRTGNTGLGEPAGQV